MIRPDFSSRRQGRQPDRCYRTQARTRSRWSLENSTIFQASSTRCSPRSCGFTLIEMLVATTLTLIMMYAVVTIFGLVGGSVSDSRATLEMSERLRAAQATLQRDLGGLTVTMNPPRNPDANEGYFEYIEGPLGVVMFDQRDTVDVSGADPETVIDQLLLDNPSAWWFPLVPTKDHPRDSSKLTYDSTVGDYDDILMFTTRSRDKPFVGKYGTNGTVESRVAEIVWFVRGDTLYRRVLLVAPGYSVSGNGDGFFANNDISVRQEEDSSGTLQMVANTLGDLTRRECRFGHAFADLSGADAFPYDVRRWGQLRLPTLRECSSVLDVPNNTQAWRAGNMARIRLTGKNEYDNNKIAPIDLWLNPHPWSTPGITWNITNPESINQTTGTVTRYHGTRIAEDVILTNVIGFDVKVWDPKAPILEHTVGATTTVRIPGDPGYPPFDDPWQDINTLLKKKLEGDTSTNFRVVGYGAYVDLAYARAKIDTHFSGGGKPKSQLNTGLGWTYDTWSTHYEHDGQSQDDDDNNGTIDNNDIVDEGTDGFDNDGDGIVDDADEQETSPPYPVPLRGIQIKIRVFEPDSRQIREVTVRQDFLPR